MKKAKLLPPLVVLGLYVGMCWSCASPPRAKFEGDDGWGSEPQPGRTLVVNPHTRAIPPDERRRWKHADQIARLAQVGGRSVSEHIGGGFERTVRINELAAGYRRLPGPHPMPPGAMIIQLHHSPGSKKVSTAFVMRKLEAGKATESGDWQYLVLDGQLRVESPPKVPLCARCHLAAPHDSLFGPPQP